MKADVGQMPCIHSLMLLLPPRDLCSRAGTGAPIQELQQMMFLHAGVFTHRSFYTQSVYTEKLFNREAFTQMLHTEAFTQTSVFSNSHKSLFTQTPLRRAAFTFHPRNISHSSFYNQMLLHRETFTHGHLYARSFYTGKPLHNEAFTHRHFYDSPVLSGGEDVPAICSILQL